MNFTLQFPPESDPSGTPWYERRDNETQVLIYFGQPPLRQRGVWISFRRFGYTPVYAYLVKPLAQFDQAELDAVVRDFVLIETL